MVVPYLLPNFILQEYLESVQDVESDQNNWRAVKKDHLLSCCSCVKLTLASGDVGECREALESFDGALRSVKPYVNGADELSRGFLELKGHLYMHTGTFLLKMAQNNEMQWRDACELTALCYLKFLCNARRSFLCSSVPFQPLLLCAPVQAPIHSEKAIQVIQVIQLVMFLRQKSPPSAGET